MLDGKIVVVFARRFQEASSLCDSSLRKVMSNEGLGQVQVYERLVGNFMGNSFTNVLAPESQDALRAFLVEARAAMEFVKSNVGPEESKQLFAFGGLTEVEDTITAIESFLKKPRFRDSEPE